MEGTKTLNCIIHYENQKNYSQIKKLSDINKEKILKAREKRESIGGDHYHEEQCSSIPAEFDIEVHGVHLDPCYKR